MTSLIESEPATPAKDFNSLHKVKASDVYCHENRQRRHVLKSKENTYKHKCYKVLRKKLKKYKLRQDGTEDQDVIDVSKILVSSLVIKSPSNEQEAFAGELDLKYFEELRPKNYLFKMVRRKDNLKMSNNITKLSENVKCNNSVDKSTTIDDKRKHTNAFRLLMDSRNKSIGTNSPGKNQNNDCMDSDEVVKRKSEKAKRNLVLQKMAESKGYNKNKELEEYHDKIIKKKMDKRADRLKAMILKESKSIKLADNSEPKETKDPKLSKNIQTKKPKEFKIFDIFNTLNDPVSEHIDKPISKEDNDFLNKLSPSLKKTGSVLNYFKKVDKEPEICTIEVENDEAKAKYKFKKKGRKKKLSLKRDIVLDELQEVNNDTKANKGNLEKAEIQSSKNLEAMSSEGYKGNLDKAEVQSLANIEGKTSTEKLKRKRSTKTDNNIVNSIDLTNNTESRPKRSIKKPVKYTDDIYLSSSDEDLHIFTPKKKKYLENNISDNKVLQSEQKEVVNEHAKPNNEIKKIKDTNTIKKSVKLAPIFAAKPDAAAVEAKQKFLQSGVPDKLKKIMTQQNTNSKPSSDFSLVVHVQQRDLSIPDVNHTMVNLSESDNEENTHLVNEENAFKKLLDLNETRLAKASDSITSVKAVLQTIKQLHPKFPVYRTYHYLRNKGKGEFTDCKIDVDNSIEVVDDITDVHCDSPERLSWTDKYKAISTNRIIGNFESVKELKKWLESWTENELKSRNKGCESDSDFYQSDTDSRDSFKSMHNLLVLTGPTGCGKTSCVYAVAADLSMKVIEVNASSKRTGKIMLQDLQEATQSHKVNRGTSDNSQKSQEKTLTELLKNSKKRGRPKKSTEKVSDKGSTPSSQESIRTAMSLILIDDADIVFDQDDGFSSAIVQLVHCSKRPVILITSSLTSPHLQRFLNNGKILKMSPLSPNLLGTWLDIMCLADSGISWPGDGAKFLDYFKGDIRKTINYLQFYISRYIIDIDEERGSQNIDNYKKNIDDENSGMSWADSEDLDKKQITMNNNIDTQPNTMWVEFDNNNSDIRKFRFPLKLFDIWWSIPRLLAEKPITDTELDKFRNIKQEVERLDAIADVLDAISLSDCVIGSSLDTTDITTKPWYSSASDSMSEQNNIDDYMHKYEVSSEISHTMVTGYIDLAQKLGKCEQKKKISFPGMSLERKRDKVISRHTTITSHLNPCTLLDRRSLTLDYWSCCRSICRIEKAKSDANVGGKRHNRYCHYLKSLSVLCSNDMFTNLCQSLSNEGSELNIIELNK